MRDLSFIKTQRFIKDALTRPAQAVARDHGIEQTKGGMYASRIGVKEYRRQRLEQGFLIDRPWAEGELLEAYERAVKLKQDVAYTREGTAYGQVIDRNGDPFTICLVPKNNPNPHTHVELQLVKALGELDGLLHDF